MIARCGWQRQVAITRRVARTTSRNRGICNLSLYFLVFSEGETYEEYEEYEEYEDKPAHNIGKLDLVTTIQ